MFSSVTHESGSECLDIQDDFELISNVRMSQMYFRAKTRTVVLDVHVSDESAPKVILKVLWLPEPSTVPNGFAPSCDVEVKYLSLLSRLLNRHVTPHLTLPVARCMMRYAQVKRLLRRSCSIKTILQMAPGHGEDRYMAFFAERANHETLTNLIRKDMLTMRPSQLHYVLVCVIYQVVFTLAAVHIRLPSFKHNDLHTSNVLIHLLDLPRMREDSSSSTHFVRYTEESGRDAFIDLSACPYRVMLWDFYFASINEADARRWGLGDTCPARKRLGASRCTTSRVCVNQYTDLHKMLDTLEYVLRTAKLWQKLYPHMRQFFDDVVPTKYKCASIQRPASGREKLDLHSVQHSTPRDLLSHPIFSLLEKPNSRRPIQPLEAYHAMRSLPVPELSAPRLGSNPLV